MRKAVILTNSDSMEYVYGEKYLKQLREITDLYPEHISLDSFKQHQEALAAAEVAFSTWGMPVLSDIELDMMPKLKAVFYAAGSVQSFAAPFLKRGIKICSAVAANAVPVAEYCLAQILLACKNYHQHTAQLNSPQRWKNKIIGPGVFGEKIGLIGIGAISRHLLSLLQPFHLQTLAVSGYLQQQPEETKRLGISKLITVEEAFKEAYVLSNHLPRREKYYHYIKQEHFLSMRQNATFINTGRGAQVDHPGMIAALKERPDLTAILDVTDPEPPQAGSELYDMPNVFLTAHIAGSLNDEVKRMAEFMLAEFKRYEKAEPLEHEITLEMFGNMA